MPLTNRTDKTYIMTCSECREFWKDILNEDRKSMVDEFKEYIKESFETRQDIQETQLRHSKVLSWLIIYSIIQGLTTISIIFYLINK